MNIFSNIHNPDTGECEPFSALTWQNTYVQIWKFLKKKKRPKSHFCLICIDTWSFADKGEPISGIIYHKPEVFLALCVPPQRKQYIWAPCVKSNKVSPCHIFHALMEHVRVSATFTQLTSDHLCTVSASSSNLPAELLAVSQEVKKSSTAWAREKGKRVNFTLSFYLQCEGLTWKQEMSSERQACPLLVPVATSLQVEIK